MFYRGSALSNVQATFPELFEYFPSDRARQIETPQFPATAMFFVLTRHNFENIIYWYVLWALEKPRHKVPVFGNCKYEVKNISTCHRFDQSCINILLSNLHSFNHTVYGFAGHNLPLKFVRGDASMARDCSRVLTGTVTNDTRAQVAKMRDKILKNCRRRRARVTSRYIVVSESLKAVQSEKKLKLFSTKGLSGLP